MRAVCVCLVASIATISSVSPVHAGPFFDCLRSEKFTIPAITTPWGSTGGPIIIQPASGTAQSGLGDVFTSKLIETLLNNWLSGGNTKPPTGTPPSGDSDSMKRANDTLDRIDGKIDRLEELITNRLSKVESDIATVAKAQRESTAQLEKRLVETTNLVKENTKLIMTNAEAIRDNTLAIQQTQDDVKALYKKTKNELPEVTGSTSVVPPEPSSPSMVSLTTVAGATSLNKGDVSLPNELVDGSKVEKRLDLQDGRVIVRWKKPRTNAGESEVAEWYDLIVDRANIKE
jgi:hypothetical protein